MLINCPTDNAVALQLNWPPDPVIATVVNVVDVANFNLPALLLVSLTMYFELWSPININLIIPYFPVVGHDVKFNVALSVSTADCMGPLPTFMSAPAEPTELNEYTTPLN